LRAFYDLFIVLGFRELSFRLLCSYIIKNIINIILFFQNKYKAFFIFLFFQNDGCWNFLNGQALN